MKLQPLTLARFVLVLAVMGVLTAPAWGLPVFTTSVDLGGYAAVYFTSAPNAPGYPPEVFASIFCPDTNAGVDHPFNPSTDTIDITVIETGPDSGSFTFHGVFSGNPADEDVRLTFATATYGIGEWIYTIAPSTIVVPIADSKQNNIDGYIVVSPEPSYFGILAVGLVGFCFFRYGKSKTQAASRAGL